MNIIIITGLIIFFLVIACYLYYTYRLIKTGKQVIKILREYNQFQQEHLKLLEDLKKENFLKKE
jgi:hypothetical protein